MTKALSLNPETFEQGGGFEGPMTLLSALFVSDYDFNGKAKPQAGLVLELVGDSGKAFTKFYGIGKASKFAIINGGKALQPVGATKGLNVNCKTAILIGEMVNSCGIDPEGFNSGDITFLEGLHAEWANAPQKEFVGKDVKTQSGEDAQILVPREVYLLPDEDETEEHTRFTVTAADAKGKKTAAKGKAAAKKGKGGKSKGPSEEDLATEAAAIVLGVLADNDGSIAKAKLTSAAIKAIGNDNDNKAALVKLCMSADFLNSQEDFNLEDKIVSLS